MFSRPIHISLSPNLELQDVLTTFKVLVQPWKWRRREEIIQVEEWFKHYFSVETAVTFDAGRSGLRVILESLDLPQGSEVLTQAFTCVAVPNSIFRAKLVPVYVDIDENFNIDISDAKKKLTPHTKVLIVQHTFGVPASLDKIMAFCKKNNLLLIENCAHSLGATYKQKKVGTFGDVAFFSFGRDKIISSIWGGIVITNNKRLGTKFVQYQKELKMPSIFWIIQQLLHPIITFVSLYTYTFFSFGKALLWISQKLHLLSLPISESDKRGTQIDSPPKQMPSALAALLISQLSTLANKNYTRVEMATKWQYLYENSTYLLPSLTTGAVPLRYTIITERADEIRFRAKKTGIILGNWYRSVIDPDTTDLIRAGYVHKSCPRAERIAGHCINLPTYPSLSDDQMAKIAKFFS